LEIENTFTVRAAPEHVYAYLVDVNRVVGCVPGASLSEVVDPTTFKGRVKIKVGPVSVSYDGTARIVSQDVAAHTAAIEAEGRESIGSGSARATTHMSVVPDGDGSLVRFSTDFTVVGRVAQFGRGIMEDVSRRLVDQMAACIRQRLEAEEAGETAPSPAGGADGAPASSSPATAPEPPHAEPEALDAIALARGVAADRLRRPQTLAALALFALLAALLLRWRRRARG
jgi:carbon monoxide dehydrogenase subunit G